MFNFLPAPLIGFLSFFLYTINTLLWLVPIIIFSLLKALIPIAFSQKIFSYLLDQMASNWVAVNTLIQKLFCRIEFNVSGLEKLSLNDWYIVVSNHQSWVDILVLQRLLHGKIPFLKFFLKKELIYVPLLGIAWWALDFPFMKRYSQAFLKKNPHLIGKDLETTRKACAKFKHKPVSIMNFIEGTRFTKEKHQKQKPKFEHLLRPKAGGIAFALDAMSEHVSTLVDVTIHYPDGIPTFMDFACGQVKRINVDVNTLVVADGFSGDYFKDKSHKAEFHRWLNELWLEKDKKLNDYHQATQ